MSWTETTHAGADALARELAASLAIIISHAIETRGRAVLALAGGRTPFPVYRLLAELPLAWDRVTLLCTDERWVPADHAARNERELAAAFAPAAGVRILLLVPPEPGDAPDVHCADASLAQVAEPFDAVLLGMGGDGHFASLFPGATELARGLAVDAPDALVVHPEPLPPEAPFARISLSLPRLLNARRLLLVICGEGKREVLQRAQRGNDASALPIAALLHRPGSPLEIHWNP